MRRRGVCGVGLVRGRRGLGVVALVTALAVWWSVLGGAKPALASVARVGVGVGGRVQIVAPGELVQTVVRPVVPVGDVSPVVPVVRGRVPVWPAAGEVSADGVSGQALRVGLAADSPVVGAVRGVVESRGVAEALVGGGLGVVWTLAGPVGAVVEVAVDYGGFAGAGGAGWSSRLGLMVLPGCAVSTPQVPECGRGSAVSGVANDRVASRVSGRVELSEPVVVVALAATTGSQGVGDFTATGLAASSSWVGGVSGGAFTWSYPLPVPPVAGGLAPSLAISYDSGVANGRTSATNNQSSWVGEGFELAGGFIERKYSACADEAGGAGSNNTVKTGDLCWGIDDAVTHDAPFDNATLSLAGHSGELVRVGNSSRWRLKVDDGTRIEKVGSVGAGSESWKVTTTDGTKYFFGKASVNGIATNSVWKVPVAGNDAIEPGYAASFGSSFSSVAWRWNLDSVVSITGDSMTFVYAVESNKYKQNLGAAVSYDRGGYLSEIRYGERSGSESGSAPGKVVFTVAERCYSDDSLPDCGAATPNADNGFHWPDVPVDALCSQATCAATQTAPTFFTRKRLARVDTFMAGVNVDRWTVTVSFPDPGDNSPTVLWPASVQHKSMSGAQITLPAVTLTPTMKPNRLTGLGTGSALTRPRLGGVTTETGARIVVVYGGPSDCDVDVALDSNIQQCFPAFYSQGGSEPALEWFSQWLADSVWEYDTAATVDAGGAGTTPSAQAKRTSYAYGGGGAWRYADSPLTPKKYRTWNVWRGYATVTTSVGDPGLADPLLVTEQLFYRGMHGDEVVGEGTKTVQVVDSRGTEVDDWDWLAGMTREVRTLTAVGGGEVSGQIDDRWASAVKADDGRRQAKVVGTSQTRTRQTTTAGVRHTQTTIVARNADELPSLTESTGDTGVTGDESCTRTSYATTNTTAWIVGKIAESSVMPALCAVPADLGQVISAAKYYYDGSTTVGAVPSKGLLTRTDTITGSSTRVWASTTTTHDQHGRSVSATDALGNTTTTSYTPATGSPVTQVKTISADPDGAGPSTALTTSTTLDPKWGVPTKRVAPGGVTTAAALDSLGRVTAVWKPGRDLAASASVKYGYTINAAGVNAVKTETLNADGTTYLASYILYDSLLRARQTQTKAANGDGRVITDSHYDARGLTWRSLTYWGAGDPAAVMVEPAPTSTIPFETRTAYDHAARPIITAFWAYGYEQWRTTSSYTGDTTTIIPPSGATPTTTTTDVHGRITALTQHLGVNAEVSVPRSTTTYTYNPAGFLTQTVDPKGNTWTYSYDVQGNRLTSQDPDTGTTTTTYDLLGHPLTSTDARGRGVVTRYDNLYRPTATTDLTGNPLTSTTWDTLKAGLITQTTRTIGTTQLIERVNSYDTAARPTSTSLIVPTIPGLIPAQLAGTYSTTTSYNPDGSTATVGLPATGPVPAETLTYTYTPTNLPNATTGTPTAGTSYPYANATTYTPLGEVQWLKLGAAPYNSQLKYDYDLSTRRLATTSHYLNTTLAEQTAYTYTPSGLITSQTTQPSTGAADTQCYTYDTQQQLTQAWTPASNDCTTQPSQNSLGGPAPYWTTWVTDTIGKTSERVDQTPTTSTTTTYTYNPNGSTQPHFVTATTNPNGTNTYNADPAGHTIKRPHNTTTQTLTWNDEGKLATINTGPTTIQTNLYNAAGQRIIRTEPNRTTLWVADTELTHTTTTNTLTANRTYTHTGHTIANRTGPTNDTITTLIPDRQNTTHQQVNTTNGTITTTWHAPYGRTRTNPTPWIGERGFVGGTNDTTTGLVHIGARDYDTTLNQFITTDPLHDLTNPLNYNPYTYANNNPTTHTDPTGLYSALDGYADPARGVLGDSAITGIKPTPPPKPTIPATTTKPPSTTSTQPNQQPGPGGLAAIGGAIGNAINTIGSIASQAADYAAGHAPQIAIAVGVTAATAAFCIASAVVGCIVAGMVLGATGGWALATIEGRPYTATDMRNDMALGGLTAGGGGLVAKGVGAVAKKLLGPATNSVSKVGWNIGDDIYNLTKAGNSPSWSTVRSRFWKNEAANPQYGSWSDEQLARMGTGRAPQRYNPDKGGIESMDLSHEPIPFRDGGTNVVPRWPQDHAAIDPFRRPGY